MERFEDIEHGKRCDIRKIIVVQYPPDFDGELHIKTKRKSSNKSIDAIEFSFIHAARKTETEREVLIKVAKAILRQNW